MAQCIIGNSRGDFIVASSRVRFQKDPLAEAKLSTWPGLIPELEDRVKAAEVIAIATAPVESGDYKEGISSDVGYDERGKVIGRLLATDWKSVWVEFGTIKTPAHATLRKAMDAIGLRVSAASRGRKS